MSDSNVPQAIIVMGVCGAGKSTIGRALADTLGCPFLESDDFQTETLATKTRAGIATSEQDREPWLDRLRQTLESHVAANRSVVLACAALREEDRERLQSALHPQRWIFLQGNRELLAERMHGRTDHHLPPERLDAQIATLEVPAPANALWCDVATTPDEILEQALRYLRPS